jgi:hypothetical protein
MTKKWQEVEIINDNGEFVTSIAPLIISASRATDIPAFFAKWFIERLKKGYVKWINPFNRTSPFYISFSNTKVIVFWSKNPKPMIEFLPELDRRNIKYYFQFTLNDYEKEGFEPNVPDLRSRIQTFIELSKLIGKDKVIWRFDPLILNQSLTIEVLLDKINRLAEKLVPYTNKLVFSFVDINEYPAVQKNIIKDIPFFGNTNSSDMEFSHEKKIEFAGKISSLLNNWKSINPDMRIATCAEDIDLKLYNIEHNKCIDDELMIRLFNHDEVLMDFLGYRLDEILFDTKRPNLKDKGQRKSCGCIVSKDIGSYNTCNHLCTYCYANSSRKMVEKHQKEFIEISDKI